MTRQAKRQLWIGGAAAVLLGLSACETLPTIRSETAPGAEFSRYRTYDYFDKPSTDRRGYKTITTRSIEDAIDREMSLRGLKRAPKADLKINFHIAKRDKVTSRPGSAVGFGYGYGGWRSHYGYDIGFFGRPDIETITEGTLTIDVVDRVKNELVWSGSASRKLDAEVLDQPRKAIDQAVNLILAKFPISAAAAAL